VSPAPEAAESEQASLFATTPAIDTALLGSAPAPEPAKAKTPKRKTGLGKARELVTEAPGAEEIAEVLHEAEPEPATEDEEEPLVQDQPRGPEPKLERLQKILAKAGVASRRAAEELIAGGHVQINGTVVTELGTKADAGRDHIRVNGKLLQGPERLRYFVLNKPKGYVTTVSDPEGRATVMQFFAGERERLYPVGRLDYLSEGLLLVTNDGELANKLTKAASGVEKAYLVKVAGHPPEESLDQLRAGVVIERGRHGEGGGRVRTAPARIRQVREGDNPWFEVILIEGRNRELRKMFEEIGHHVEKIRRVGYGPLVLDLEPGKLRELEADEVHKLRLTAEGKLKPKKRRGPAPAQLPTVAGRTVRYKNADGKPGFEPRPRREARPEVGAGRKPAFRSEGRDAGRPQAGRTGLGRPGGREFKSEFKPGAKPEFKPEFKPRFESGSRPPFKSGGKPEFRPGSSRPPFAGKPRREEPPVQEYVLPPRKARPYDDDEELPRDRERFAKTKPEGDRNAGRPGQGARPSFRQGPRESSPREAIAPRDAASGLPTGKRMHITELPAGSTGQKPFRPRTGGFKPREGNRFGSKPPARGQFQNREDRGQGFRGGRDERPSRAAGPPRAAGPRPGGSRPGGPARAGGPPRPGAGRPFRPSAAAPSGQGTGRRRFEGGGEDRPREFRPRTGGARPGAGSGSRPARPGGPAGGDKGRTGPDGEARVKNRWRNSFTGKNKGRPKPKPKGE